MQKVTPDTRIRVYRPADPVSSLREVVKRGLFARLKGQGARRTIDYSDPADQPLLARVPHVRRRSGLLARLLGE